VYQLLGEYFLDGDRRDVGRCVLELPGKLAVEWVERGVRV
jgi:hypothetical protein